MPGSPRPEQYAPDQAEVEQPRRAGDARHRARLLFDISRVDFSVRLAGREEIARFNPHRGEMALLDWIIWQHPERSQGVGLKHVRDDEFWVPGHFPGSPMMPGVMMIEAGAQLACYLYICRRNDPSLVAFLRIEHAAFRATVRPGQDLYLLCNDVKVGRRNFTCDIQGLTDPTEQGGKIAFDARVSGMMI